MSESVLQARYINGTDVINNSSFLNRWSPILLFALAVALNWPYLMAGYYVDDFLLIGYISSNDASMFDCMSTWISTDTPAFQNLWWTDGDFALSAWRPLPKFIIGISTLLFGKNPLPLHLFSIVMHGLVTLLIFYFVLEISRNHAFSFLSGLFFVICEDHSLTIGWISTNTDILCTFAVLLYLYFHVIYLRNNKLKFLIASLLSLIMAMACKETAVVAPIIALLLTLLFPHIVELNNISKSRLIRNLKPTLRSPIRWLPALVILLVYLGIYKGMHLGQDSSLQYFDPLSDLGEYVLNLFSQLPIMWLGTLTIWPPFISSIDVNLLPYLIGPGCMVFCIWIVGLWLYRKQPIAVWAMLAYILALLPNLCTMASERGLYLPMAFGAILIAWPILSLKLVVNRLNTQQIISTRWTRTVGWLIIYTLLFPGIIISVIRPFYINRAISIQEENVRTALTSLDIKTSNALIVTNASDIMQTFYIQAILEHQSDLYPNVFLLSAAPGNFTLERTGESSFVIRTDRPGWINNTMARYVRTKPSVRIGQSYTLNPFTATISQVTPDQTDALTVRFDFNSPAAIEDIAFLTWRDEHYEPFNLEEMPIGSIAKLSSYKSTWDAMLSAN